MIYIVCPNFKISGGPEALHQLSYYLTKNKIENRIAYFGKKCKNPTAKTYEKYQVKYVWLNKRLDKIENHIIFPEANLKFNKFFKKAKKSIWWLGIGTYLERKVKFSLKERMLSFLSGLKNKDIIKIQESLLPMYKFSFDDVENHFFGSYYAENFLKENNCKNVFPLIEPLGFEFIHNFNKAIFKSVNRKNLILYNPQRVQTLLKKLSENFPDLKFKPIQNLTHKEIGVLFRESKLYVDFGHFPGPERLPKEAVSMGCCVITSRKGAANFYGDVSIPEEYKFSDDANLEDIYKRIRECLENYEKIIPKFEEYRQRVYNLESNFEKQIVKIFGPGRFN